MQLYLQFFHYLFTSLYRYLQSIYMLHPYLLLPLVWTDYINIIVLNSRLIPNADW